MHIGREKQRNPKNTSRSQMLFVMDCLWVGIYIISYLWPVNTTA
uniref:Uncharacterized protein n=1 Tax=Lepeophtheirus salmonis TaxID=72036 RepID=A0A0K2UTK4_LEPSM